MRRYGFIGLGIMGKPICQNLLRRPAAPWWFTTSTPPPCRNSSRWGPPGGPRPRQVAAESDVVFTMLPNSPDVKAAVLGPESAF